MSAFINRTQRMAWKRFQERVAEAKEDKDYGWDEIYNIWKLSKEQRDLFKKAFDMGAYSVADNMEQRIVDGESMFDESFAGELAEAISTLHACRRFVSGKRDYSIINWLVSDD